jgi:glutathione synthase/RimK-type ligase-like ATP-grasp enzyme
MSILIVSLADDVHAVSVRKALREQGFRDCFLVETDNVNGSKSISLRIGHASARGLVRDAEGRIIAVEEARVLWMRRLSPSQTTSPQCDGGSRELVNNDSGGAISALFDTCFKGSWISNPTKTMEASNKIYQLEVARHCGFRVPDTLVTQDKQDVEEFAEIHRGEIIVKPVVGMESRFLLTRKLSQPELIAEEAYEQCPAIYQEYIPGTRHVRLNCFGDLSFAASIETLETDWRPDLRVPVSIWPVPYDVHARIRKVLDALGLAMGVVDLKETPSGDLVWFEVNPQGQFLFLEPLTGMKLSQYFAEFLIDEWGRPRLPSVSAALPATNSLKGFESGVG